MSDTANAALADISSPVETIEVVIDPSAAVPVFDKPEFLQQLVERLICARSAGQKMVAVDPLAKHLNVAPRDLDEWAKNQPRLARRVGKKNVVYYGLSRPAQVVLGDSEFDQLLLIVLTEDDKKWKSLSYLAKQLAQDEAALSGNLDKYSGLLRRVGKEQKVYYALASRFDEKEKGQAPKNTCAAPSSKPKVGSTLTIEEVLALGMIHPLSDGFLRTMNFYGNRLAVHHPTAYAHFATAQKELSSGLALLMSDLGIKDKQMPDIESV